MELGLELDVKLLKAMMLDHAKVGLQERQLERKSKDEKRQVSVRLLALLSKWETRKLQRKGK